MEEAVAIMAIGEEETIRDVVDEFNSAAFLSSLSPDAMPTDDCYVRSNFGIPQIDHVDWRLSVAGLVDSPMTLSLDDVRSFGEVSELVVFECAGNGRLLMEPVPDGTPWGIGAVSVAEFTGTPLRRVLAASAPSPDAVEWVFTGLDRGETEPDGEVNFAFSVPAADGMSDGPLLAWAMNGEPLRPEHGAPLRLVVPGGYGMQSVKWLTSITAVDTQFTGHFRRKYRYLADTSLEADAPVDRMRVRALATSPADGASVTPGCEVAGIAWSGDGAIAAVEVAVDDGLRIEADLGRPLGRFAPVPWRVQLQLGPGNHTIAVRATDSSGATQPIEPIWNENGYGNNVVQRLAVNVEE